MNRPHSDEDKTQSHVMPAPGSMVHHYRIVERIGVGGMGEVFLAEDTKLDRATALKFLPPHAAGAGDARSRFLREARAAAKLNHPNIVTVYEVGEFAGRPFFAMEYVPGETLHAIARRRTLTLAEIADVIRQCAEGLAEAHRQSVVHRDVKPANIVMDRVGRARLVDFGLAAMPGNDHLTRPGTTMGTLAYMSPEQVRGAECDYRTDLFALGVVWYELLTGTSPFERDNSAASLQAILEHAPPRPLHDGAPIPDPMWALLERLLAKSPDDRPRSAEEVATALRDMLNDTAAAAPSLPSIAVLPFTNMSEDSSQEHFCDGIAEDIINDLTRLPGLRVVARTSAFAFKGKNEDMRVIGRRLNVGTILEGSVRKAGQRVRVTAQLINVADGFHLWSERYDREITDIFAIQDDIARNVVGKLVGYLLPVAGRVRSRQVDIAAYERHSQGRFHLSRRNAVGFSAALSCFREALAAQPDYAPGYIGLADAYFLQYAYELVEPRDAIARARAALLHALEIDPNAAEAYTTLGGILTFHDWAWEEAETAFRRSIELNPGYAVGHQWYGELLAVCGRIEEAEAQFRRARELDPLADIVVIMHGVALYVGGRHDEAMALFREAIAMGTQNENAYCWLGFAQLQSGRTGDALRNMEQAREHSGNSVFSTVMHAHACALAGDTASVERIAAEIERRSAGEYVSPALRSVLAFDLGQHQQAYHWLKEAIRRHNSEAMIMSIVPYYAAMREDPTIHTLLGVLGLIR